LTWSIKKINEGKKVANATQHGVNPTFLEKEELVHLWEDENTQKKL
jgi:hypothetical protein